MDIVSLSGIESSSFNRDRIGNATTKQLRKIENTQMFIYDRVQYIIADLFSS